MLFYYKKNNSGCRHCYQSYFMSRKIEVWSEHFLCIRPYTPDIAVWAWIWNWPSKEAGTTRHAPCTVLSCFFCSQKLLWLCGLAVMDGQPIICSTSRLFFLTSKWSTWGVVVLDWAASFLRVYKLLILKIFYFHHKLYSVFTTGVTGCYNTWNA